jgi:hypothetical protein
MTIDPAKFVVIDDKYAQQTDYPRFCAETVQRLIQRTPRTINDLVKVIAEEIATKNSKPEHRLHIGYQGEQKLYGLLRQKPDGSFFGLCVPIDERGLQYREAYLRFLEREFGSRLHGAPFIKVFHHETLIGSADGTSHRVEAPLTMISNCRVDSDHVLIADERGPEVIYHSNMEPEVAKAVWKDINSAYQKALDPTQSRDKRIEKSLECYYLISHYAPLIRRSATLARIALAYLEEKVGFDLPPARPGIDINLEALTRTMPDFIHQVDRGTFFDPQLASEDVLEWQKRAAAKQLHISRFEKTGYSAHFALQNIEETPLERTHTPAPRKPFDFSLRVVEKRDAGSPAFRGV